MAQPKRRAPPESEPGETPDIHALAQQWLAEALEELEERLCALNGYSYHDDEGFDMALTDALRSTTEQLMENDFSQIKEEVDGLLKTEGAGKLPKELYRRLCREILKAKQILVREEIQRGQGMYQSTSIGVASRLAVKATPVEKKPASPPISKVIPEYLKEFERRAPKTLIAKVAALKRFVWIIGDKPLSYISSSDGLRYRDTMAQLPTQLHKRFPKKTVGEVLKAMATAKGREGTDVNRISLSTINAELKRLTHFFHWAMAKPRQYLQDNPVARLRFEDVEDEHYDPFTNDDLKSILLDDDFQRQKEVNPPQYWLPLILLFTGARREEIANLALEDVKDEDSIPYFDVVKNLTRSRRLKTKSSRRVIPIHSALLQRGFVQYVAQCRKSGVAILFPNEYDSKAPTSGNAISRWFSRLLQAKGIVGKKAMKSFRPTFTTRLHEAGVDGETRRRLTGHAGTDVHEVVYLKPSLPLLKTAIEKLQLEWLP